MPQYGFVPLSRVAEFGDVTQYPVRFASYIPNVSPDITDQNGNPIYNVLQTEANETYTVEQAAAHVACGGMTFADANEFITYLEGQYA